MLENIQIKSVPFTDKEVDSINSWALLNQKLFSADNLQSKSHSPLEKAFGVVTFSYQSNYDVLQAHHLAIQAMQTTVTQHVGEQHQDKFELSQLENFKLISKLWLSLHGKLEYEFSLANDNARNAADLITKFESRPVDQLRTELLKFYYIANENNSDTKSHTLLSKVKHFFKF